MLSAVIRSALGYPAFTVGMITGTLEVRPSRSSRTRERSSQCSMQVNVGVFINDVLKRARVKKGQRFSFAGRLIQFLRGHQIDEKVVDYRPRYDPKSIDLMKIKDPKGMHDPMLSISERHARIDNVLSHLYGMQIL
ncbi:hypothetical protein HAX54_029804 [Datura stramonium]|uniref:Uncharacterized protein n=1 Tax=Datura stramonium TaxID=4076 RepID=A0ABS8V6I0_DATST|nr:hypothetical protein [Datura stramonium]